MYSRVLIVDWDVHHGQGVQYCFEDDPRWGRAKWPAKWFPQLLFYLASHTLRSTFYSQRALFLVAPIRASEILASS